MDIPSPWNFNILSRCQIDIKGERTSNRINGIEIQKERRNYYIKDSLDISRIIDMAIFRSNQSEVLSCPIGFSREAGLNSRIKNPKSNIRQPRKMLLGPWLKPEKVL